VAIGDAPFLGDVSSVPLNGPVLDSVGTPTGHGYYMVASDGGIFSFGDARFYGSMGGRPLNAPVRSVVPTATGDGYWLVASDGGIFAFSAPFRGSMGAQRLNRPVIGMVRFGDGYLMVASDGGVFDFSSLPFAGSLGGRPPADPVVALAPYAPAPSRN
jgi:ribosomal protein L24E